MKIFVIMPFSKTTKKHNKRYWDSFFKRISGICKKNHETIEKIFNVSAFKIHRASAPQGNIVKSILKDLKESDIVIAVLTDHNANVFYELGIRHTQSNKTILLCEESQDIPFDLKNYGVGFYKDNKLRYKHIENELLERFEQIASNPDKPDNPFLDFAAKPQSSIKSEKPTIKVSIVDQIEGEPLLNPPKFYREAQRKGGGEVVYTNRTFFIFTIELRNNGTEPISIVDSILELSISSQTILTNKLYHGKKFIETAKASVGVLLTYKNKFTINARAIYQGRVAFVLDQFVPQDVSEISGTVQIVDMFNNKHSSSEIEFTPYC